MQQSNHESLEIYQLNPDYDSAVQLWGGKWRMPTYDDFKWLENNCVWTWIDASEGELFGGFNIYSPDTKNSIFLPAAGDVDIYSYENGKTNRHEDICFYLSSTWGKDPDKEWIGVGKLWVGPSELNSSETFTYFCDEQYLGTIRPVHN